MNLFKKNKKTIPLFVLLAISIVYGLILNADSNMRDALIADGNQIVATINFDKIKSLSGTDEDIKSPDYLYFKKQFSAIKNANDDYKFLYCLGLNKENKVFFFVDDVLIGAEDEEPPGLIYTEAPIEMRKAFNTKKMVVTQPYKDRWGTFVSVVIPILDKKTGELITVFVIDVDAKNWNETIVRKIAMSVFLVLSVLIFLSIKLILREQNAGSKIAKPIQKKLLFPLATVLLIVFAGFSFVLIESQNNNITNANKRIIERAFVGLPEDMEIQASAISAIGDVILRNDSLRVQLKKKDRASLLGSWEDLFLELKQKHGITHFYFHDASRKNILRVHNPKKHGDLIDRFTAIEAERTRGVSSGIELGTLGTFTLRVVQPVFDDGEIIGYIELGKEIEDILEHIHETHNIELALLINKNFLPREKWENGLRLLGRTGDWNRFKDFVLIYSSLAKLPEGVDSFVGDGKHIHHAELGRIEINDKLFYVEKRPLKDVSSKGIGEIILLNDMTDIQSSFDLLLKVALSVAGLLLIGLLGFLYVVLRRADLSILKQSEKILETNKSLKETTEQFYTLAEQTSSFIWRIDNDGLYTDISGTAEITTGYKVDEIIGKKHFYDLHPESGRSSFKQEVLKEMQKKEAFVNFKNLIESKDKQVVWIETSAIPILDEDGKMIGYQGIDTDITLRHKTQEALIKAKVEAENATVAKSNFLANMSHEIRTPMNGVLGMTELLLETTLDNEQYQYAKTANSSGKSLLTIINDILDFSKIESGKLNIEEINFDLRSLLNEFSQALAQKAQEKSLEFICSMSNDTPAFLKGDPGRLRQVLINLVSNAIKFTQAGEVAIFVDVISQNEDDANIRFTVKDTGIGISKEMQSKLFQPFTQADASTTRKFGGTGLGLAISKELVGLMNGEIAIEKSDEDGSVFYFTVQLKKNKLHEDEKVPSVDIAGVRVLVVDDNKTNRDILCIRLEEMGALSDEAECGKTGLEMILSASEKNEPYKVAIIDLHMPNLNGFELGEAIKENPKISDLKMMLMTSVCNRGDKAKVASIGFDAYLPKPVKWNDFFDALSTILCPKRKKKSEEVITRHALRDMRKVPSIKILLAEDDKINQLVTGSFLKKLGQTVDIVEDGLQAIKALENIEYDIVLMDVQMPKLDGLEATKKIRDKSSSVLNHNIPIIAMTANAMQGDKEECLEAGMSDYLAKPIDPESFARVIAKWSK